MFLSNTTSLACKIILLLMVLLSLLACGDSNSTRENSEPDAAQPPVNTIKAVSLRDTNGATGLLSADLLIELSDENEVNPSNGQSVWAFWADQYADKIGDAFFKNTVTAPSQINRLENLAIPEGAVQIVLHLVNARDQFSDPTLIPFHDFKGNALLSGPGGNEMVSWYYGADRPKIPIHRQANGLCVLDNGLVSVIDMNNQTDAGLLPGQATGASNTYDDAAFPPFDFMCDPDPINTERAKVDEVGVWTYSTLNDAMYYGTVVYDTFLKYLGEPPLEDKIRLRVHYGNEFDVSVFWDGAYANFSDGYLGYYSTATLDLIAHEIAHGVLGRISALKVFGVELSDDARTLHEAFGDISGVMAKYEMAGIVSWIHGEESSGSIRQLDQIVTEQGAIPSYLDYEEAGNNFYKRIGIITYPFYKLTEKWGLETTYSVFIHSAKKCWTPLTSLHAAAECIKQQAELSDLATADVVSAFKTVKIKLLEEGVLSHFIASSEGLTVTFSDNSQGTSQASEYVWDFGDGNSSAEANPVHTYAEQGDYQVTLTITNGSSDQDTFQRLVSVI